MKKIIYTLFAILTPATAHADTVNQVFRILCMPELGYFEVMRDNINGEEAYEQLRNNPDEMWEKYKVKDLETLVNNRNTEDMTFDTFSSSCKMGEDTYEISVTPYAYPNMHAVYSCSDTTFMDVYIEKNGKIIVEKLPFVDDCASMGVLKRLRILHYEGYLQTFGTFLETFDIEEGDIVSGSKLMRGWHKAVQ